MAARAFRGALAAAVISFTNLDASAATTSSSCDTVTVSGVGGLSGNYRQIGLSSYDASYYMADGLDYYYLYLYDGTWEIVPNIESYPQYQTQDPALHPTDISLDWTVCDALGCEFTAVATDVVITCAAETSSSESTSSTCTNVDIAGTGLSAGTYRERAIYSSYDEGYYRAGGVDYYYMYKYNDAWYIEPQLAGYPVYRTFDDASNPVDIVQEWGICDSSGCDYTSAVSQPTAACTASTSSSDATATTCTSVVVSGTGLSSGTYRERAIYSSYDEGYYMAGGVDYYYMYKYNDAWFIEPQIAGYPVYRTYDDATNPVDIELEWTICDIQFCDHVPAPSPPEFACATNTTTTAASTCTSVVVSGLGDLDGTYDEAVIYSGYDAGYSMPSGADTNILYLYNDAWFIEPQDAGYPIYRTYDDATHPADVSLEWTICDIQFCDHVPAPSPPTITCADGSTPPPVSSTSAVDATASSSSTEPATSSSSTKPSTSSSSTDPSTRTSSVDTPTPAPTASGGGTSHDDISAPTPDGGLGDPTEDDPTPAPSGGSRGIDGDDDGEGTAQPYAGGEPLEAEGDLTDDDGGEDGGLSTGAIVGIVAAILVAIAGGGFAFAFKQNSIHCCHKTSVVNNNNSVSEPRQ